MVVKMMSWRPWPPLISRKYEVKLTVQRLEGGDWVPEGNNGCLAVDVRWKGSRFSLGSFRRNARRNCTREVNLQASDGPNGGVFVEWGEEFQSICSLSRYKDNSFHPWEISFAVLHGMLLGSRNRSSVVGAAVLNLSDYSSMPEKHAIEVKIPLMLSGIVVERCPLLTLFLEMLELGASHELTHLAQNPMAPAPSIEISSSEKNEISALKAGLMKVKIFTDYVSTRRAKKACREEGSEGRSSPKSDEVEYAYPFDTDSLDEFEEGETDDCKGNSAVRKSFSYGSLAHANYAGVSYYSSSRIINEPEDWIYYSNRSRSYGGCRPLEQLSSMNISEKLLIQNTKRSILPWRKRKLSFRSPKIKGEPLLKKAYGEEGGDDIDFDRRQLSSDESLTFGWHKTDEDLSSNRLSVSEFGDDCFSVGAWEKKEITSRDGLMRVCTEVFFASIDQRSERAAGESACTALVAVIADWLQSNTNIMPIRSQFDSLIRDGSQEWRNLCANETYMERFSDKHFDLDTVIEAKFRDLRVIPGKSFIGFFHPVGMDEGSFDFLHGAMSFDGIWDEISRLEHAIVDTETIVFIVSWNDHFFVLKVEADAYYIIDTLGERLHEGCNQAYILKFDRNTTIYRLPNAHQSTDEKPVVEQQEVVTLAMESQNSSPQPIENNDSKDGSILTESQQRIKHYEEIVCEGKEACKEYIKSFLAAVPIRELQADIKKGLIGSTPLHHRLQIEFHFTQLQQPAQMSSAQ